MCGILGITSKKNLPLSYALNSLKKLEYRGYDSFGFSTNKGTIFKRVGEINCKIKGDFNSILAHTRWATHGKVSKENSHPHTDCSKSIFIVHNGIIENHKELKTILKGHLFRSTTDSETIAHYLEEKLKSKNMISAISEFFHDAKGTFSVLVMKKGENVIYALKKDSPLVLGIGEGKKAIASDIYAFNSDFNKAIFFDDYEFAEITPLDYRFYNKNGCRIKKSVEKIKPLNCESKNHFRHFMIKEIKEQKIASKRLLSSIKKEQKKKFHLIMSEIRNKKVFIAGAGTSYNAALFGSYFFRLSGINAHPIISSEFDSYEKMYKNSVLIALSQSGETMDIIELIKYAKRKGAKIFSITNSTMSTIERLSSASLNMQAGKEICVAATKSFTNEVICLLELAGYNCIGIDKKINKVFMQERKIKRISKSLSKEKDIYILGGGASYPISLEIALKIKEICYIHAEGFPAGELKHGNLALIEKGTPVIGLLNEDNSIYSNIKEAESRGAEIIPITNQENVKGIKIPSKNTAEFSLLSNIAGQMIAYYIAKAKGLPIDKPRNLAKSVTVK